MSARPACLVDRDPVARAVAHVVSLLAQQAEPRLAVPGGSAAAAVGPIREALGARWGSVRLTYTDERCVPFDSTESNRGELHRAGTLSDALPPAHELPLYLDGEPPPMAAMRASHTFRRVFGGQLDVVLLGLGPDGHVASLFPGHADVSGDELIVHLENSPKPPPVRVTLTRAALLRSTHHVVLAFGPSKRPALERALRAEPGLPTSGLPGLVFITDQEVSA